jgi:hypothetical protein
MVVRIAALVAFAIIDSIGNSTDGVLSIRISDRFARAVNPVGSDADTGSKVIIGNDDNIVRPVVW